MLPQEDVEVGPVSPREIGSFADVPLARLKEIDEIAPLKGVPGFLEGSQRLLAGKSS